MTAPASRIYCSVDTTEIDAARRIAGQVAGAVGGIKLGLEFFIHFAWPSTKMWVPPPLWLSADSQPIVVPNPPLWMMPVKPSSLVLKEPWMKVFSSRISPIVRSHVD